MLGGSCIKKLSPGIAGTLFGSGYAGLGIDASQSETWVFRRTEFYPCAPLVKIQISAFTEGINKMWMDDVYVGPPRLDVADDEVSDRYKPIPFTVIPDTGTYADFPARMQFVDIRPEADVVDYDGPNRMQLTLCIDYQVLKSAPIALDSSYGTQVWRAFNFNTKRILAFYTDEKISLAQDGFRQCKGNFLDTGWLIRTVIPGSTGFPASWTWGVMNICRRASYFPCRRLLWNFGLRLP